MRFLAFALLFSVVGCGEDAQPSTETEPAPASQPVGTTPPVTQEPKKKEYHPLKLEVLIPRLPPNTELRYHDPQTDPNASLDSIPPMSPIRTVYPSAGTYYLRFSKRGYENLDVKLAMSDEGVVSPPLETLQVDLKPLPELLSAYAEAEEALAAEQPQRARVALDRVRELDEAYRDTAALVVKLQELEVRVNERTASLERARQELQRGELTTAESLPELASTVHEIVSTRTQFDQAVTAFNIEEARRLLTHLRENLTPADPANQDRDTAIADLNTFAQLTTSYEQICLQPEGAHDKLKELFDPAGAARAAQIAAELKAFAVDASFVSVRHSPTSLNREGSRVQVYATLSVEYRTAAGASTSETRVILTFTRGESWKFLDYTEAPQ